ncbi:MAG: DNA repair and recombination protein RadB [Candidatus Diapherotrites archaeon]|nr:DNA repair and recombination protein RadB [Candidatus Diapherotrites archaeon]
MIERIPLNCGIDGLLGGGIPCRSITQVYGPAGVGKTNIALQATVNTVRMGKKVAFIDPEGSFCQERVRQMAGKDEKKVLANTLLFEPSSFSEQASIISAIHSGWDEDIALVVVDSIVYYYRLEFDRENRHESSRELGVQLASLLDIARKNNAAVLVTNQVYNNPETSGIEPVGGDTLKYGSKVIVALSNQGERIARLVRHHCRQEGTLARFRITDAGLE